MPPEHVNKTISGKRVFVDAFKDGEVKSSWVWVALNPISRFLVRDKRREKDIENKPHEDEGTDRREGATSLGTPGVPETGRSRKDPILEPLDACITLISDIWSAGLGGGRTPVVLNDHTDPVL